VNMEASRWWACTWPKPATSKLSLLVRSVKGTGSAVARAAAAGEAGEPSDGGRSCIGASAVGAVGGGGIHRCGRCGRRLWTDRSSAGGVQGDVLRLNVSVGADTRDLKGRLERVILLSLLQFVPVRAIPVAKHAYSSIRALVVPVCLQ